MTESMVRYLCDPALHTKCIKTNCHLNGGVCHHTTQLRFAKQPIEKITFTFPMDVEEAEELGFIGAENDD